ncbi:glutamate--cysteine ligase [Microbacterium sp. Marseille-Q6965]|uniref:carboxylate-amine ligase n=1 Tax=Microbacterium sp. Marseille-Q6965 TaxID=2965072 RepID=UPI0021B8318C|nr:glutamate--cysteine ligase [Microbacterium sp. Marseille-Q6965]
MRTFGVEEELLLVDGETGSPLPLAAQVLALHEAGDGGGIGMEAEMQQEMIEVITSPHSSLDSLTEQIRAGRRYADARAALVGARTAAVATSPLTAHPHATRKPRYAKMMRRYGVLARECLAFGMHTHVSISSREEGVAVLDRIRDWLPVLIALGANSPFADGEDTGHASHRAIAWREWPCAGPIDVFGSVEAYDAFEEQLLASGVILDSGMLYFDARLSHNHPTVEVRVSDTCLRAEDAAGIAALTRGLVDTAAAEWRAGTPPTAAPTALLRLATWKAALCGVREQLVHPVSGRSEPARAVVDALVDHVRASLTRSGDLGAVEAFVERVFRDGTGADLQRRFLRETGELSAVVRRTVELTHQQDRPVPTPA